jgi:SIR2-like protein
LSYSFLFLGCSLARDRTVSTFMKVAQEVGGDLPHHYAIFECPDDPEAKRVIDERLARCHLTPLWFPEGEYNYVESILELLAD